MSRSSLHVVLVLCAAVGAAAIAPAALQRARHSPFTQYVDASLPGRALGDFDGDGRLDVAHIDVRGGGEHDIAVSLSGSGSDQRLEGSFASLVEGDVDHDGDLDLLATTPSGDVLIWLNDSHGRFTLRARAQPRSVSGEPAVDVDTGEALAAMVTSAPAVAARSYARRGMAVLAIRPPIRVVLAANRHRLRPPLRAPPIANL